MIDNPATVLTVLAALSAVCGILTNDPASRPNFLFIAAIVFALAAGILRILGRA